MTEIKWPEGAEVKINGLFKKWIDGVEYNFKENEWVKSLNSWSLDTFKKFGNFKVIERPIETVDPIEIKEVSKPIEPPYMPKVGDWCEWLRSTDHDWIKARIRAEIGDNDVVIQFGDNKVIVRNPANFRPIKTDREQFIEKARESDGGTYSIVEIFGKLYDSGARFKEVSG